MMSHVENVKKAQETAETEERLEARNRKIGKTIGGLVYHFIYNARPDRDLQKLIYRVKQAGGMWETSTTLTTLWLVYSLTLPRK